MRIGLTRYKNRGFNCESFARIDSRESRCESPVPLSVGVCVSALLRADGRCVGEEHFTFQRADPINIRSCAECASSMLCSQAAALGRMVMSPFEAVAPLVAEYGASFSMQAHLLLLPDQASLFLTTTFEDPHPRSPPPKPHQICLGGRFGYFVFFSARGGGKGESEAPGRGEESVFLESHERGGALPGEGGEGARDRKGVCLEFWGGGGGALTISFGAEIPTKFISCPNFDENENVEQHPTPKMKTSATVHQCLRKHMGVSM